MRAKTALQIALGLGTVAAVAAVLAVSLTLRHENNGRSAAPSGVVVSASASNTPSPTASATPSPSTDPTTGWTPYTSAAVGIFLRYPPQWKLAECDPGANYSWGTAATDIPPTILLASTRNGPSECPVEDLSPEITLRSSLVAQASPSTAPTSCGGQPEAPTAVTVDGIQGTRDVIDYSQYVNCMGTPVSKAVVYQFVSQGREYTLSYDFRPSVASDVTSSFDAMVQDSVRFAAS